MILRNIRPHHVNHKVTNSSPNIVVDPGLAYTPRDMNLLREKGIPISSQTVVDGFNDGDLSASMYLDPTRSRGFDAIDAWLLEKDAKTKLMNAHKTDSSTFDSAE